MNICIANIKGFNPLFGGVENVSCILADELVRRGHEVSFMSNEHFELCDSMELNTCVLPKKTKFCCKDNVNAAVSFLSDSKIQLVLNQSANIDEYNDFWKLAKDRSGIKLISVYHFQPFGMIHVTDQNFFIRCRNKGNLFLHVKDFFLWCRFHMYKKNMMVKHEKDSLKKLDQISDACVFLSSSYLNEIKSIVGGHSNLQAIPNAVRKCKENFCRDKKKQVVYIARMELGHKRPDRLLKVWKRVQLEFPDWELLLIGDGGAKSCLQYYAKEQNLSNVKFLGWQNPLPFLEKASVLALTSTSEGWGQVLLEAQQFGCVPIAFDSFGAARDIIEDGKNGILVYPFDLKEYAGKLKLIMRNDEARRRMAVFAQESCRQFDVSRIADMWENLFNLLLVRKCQ